MSRRLVVTGVNGFVGQHLAKQAASDGWSVHGISTQSAPAAAITEYLDGYVGADLRQQWPAATPTDAIVVHLAGLAAVGPSFGDPQAYITGNSAMITNLGEALLKAESPGRIIGVSTGAVYASSAGGSVFDEASPITFNSPYAVSKILIENQLAYYRGRGLDTVIARPFNHFGPGQGLGFLIPDLTIALRALPAGQTLRIGNLAAARDYTDVRDVARAYLTLALADTHYHSIYNVAAGSSRTGYDVLSEIAHTLGREIPPLETDPKRLRPNDPPNIVGNATRLRNEFDWQPHTDWRTSIRECVEMLLDATRLSALSSSVRFRRPGDRT